MEKISGKREEDEEAKIEKELADIYKDSVGMINLLSNIIIKLGAIIWLWCQSLLVGINYFRCTQTGNWK